METVKPGDKVSVIYEGYLENNEQFESSADTGPLDFIVGTASVMACFEQAVLGMAINETKTIAVEPENAYGPHQPELVHQLPRSTWPAEAEIKKGLVVGMTIEKEGKEHQVPATITDITDETVTIDYNHPLAGQKVIYQITMQSINGKTEPLPMADGPAGGCSGCH